MSDAALRALELATRTAPDDLAAGRAYTRALARAGRPREALAETCRRVRLGDAGAVDEVERATRPERQPGMLRAPREVLTARFDPGHGERALAVGDLLLLDLHPAHSPGGLLALGPDLRPRWRVEHAREGAARPGFGPLACGPDLVLLDGAGLLLRAGEDGRELARVDVPVGDLPEEASGSSWGDLVLVGCPPLPQAPPDEDAPAELEPAPPQGQVRAFRIEAGRFAPLWSRAGRSPVLAGPARVAIGIPHPLWLDLSGGVELAGSRDGVTAKPLPREDATQVCDLDPHGLVVTRPEGTRESLLEELALETGESRWACHVPGERLRLIGLTPELGLAKIGRFGDGAVVAVERATGAIAWRRTWRRDDSVLAAAPAEGVLYLARRVERARVVVEALDVETGEPAWESRGLELERDELGAVRFVPWRGGVALVANTADSIEVAFLAP